MRLFSFFIIFLILIGISIIGPNSHLAQEQEYVEAYSVRGDTYRPLRNNTLAFKQIEIRFITFLNKSFIFVNCSFADGNSTSFNYTVSEGYYKYGIQAHTNITRLLIVTKTKKIVFVNIITKLTKSYREILEENKELQKQVVRIIFSLQQYQGLIISSIIFAGVGALSGVVFAYSRTKTAEFGIEVLAGGYRTLAREIEEGGESGSGETEGETNKV